MTRLRLTILLTLVACAASTAAYGYFTVLSQEGTSNPAAKAETLPGGSAPTVTVSGQTVNVSVPQVSVGGKPVGEYTGGGYRIKRYPGAATSPGTGGTTPLSNCHTTISGPAPTVTCTENSVPGGSWRYTATPVLNAWTGTESLLSNAVTSTPPVTDTTAPGLTTLEMFDANGNGKVDRLVATFNETLASSTATAPWALANGPVGSSLASVATSGATATLTLNEGNTNTGVGSFTVALSAAAGGIRDAANNQSSFGPRAPADKAAPILVQGSCVIDAQNNKLTLNGTTTEISPTPAGILPPVVLTTTRQATTPVVATTDMAVGAGGTFGVTGHNLNNNASYTIQARHTDSAGNQSNAIGCSGNT